jgi:APA family basic amino acid/polyamine antiporter
MSDLALKHPRLQKTIGASQFFTLSFASIVGVGWIVVLGDWLRQAGPLGAVIVFVLAGMMMMMVGLCYAELGTMIPVSGGEIAYMYEIFGLKTSFAAGWFLSLIYVSATSFQAISAGWIAGVIFPGLRGVPLYTVRGEAVMSGALVLGLVGTLLLTLLNYLGAKSSTTFQDILTYAKVGMSALFIAAGIFWGKADNLKPLFVNGDLRSSWRGMLSVLITAPFWLAGFNVIAQVIEEKKPETSYRRIAGMLALSIGVASLFYCLVILSCSMASPWTNPLTAELPVVSAFRAAFRSDGWAKIVLLSCLLGLLATWNSIFFGASRTVFALGRARIIHPTFANIHPRLGSPSASVLFVGVVSAVGVVLGRGAIMPIVNMVSGSFVLIYLFVALGVIRMRFRQPDRPRPYRIPGGLTIPVLAALSSVFMVFESFYMPFTHSRGQLPLEWVFFVIWGLIGGTFWGLASPLRAQVTEFERRKLILGNNIRSASDP